MQPARAGRLPDARTEPVPPWRDHGRQSFGL